MKPSSDDLPALSRLLDEALDLESSSQREAWLRALPAEHAQLAEPLRQMLAAHDRTRGEGLLSDLPALGAPIDDGAAAHAGDLVGPYRLIREIGHGGMGTVWLAERADGAFKRQVALKLPRLTWAAGLAKRMARERDIGAMLEHPNIARLYDAGVDDKGRPYIALEYIDGVPIDVWCRDQHLSVRDKLQLVVQVARALTYAHGRLVVHRDLKPSNILVAADGQVRLLDFGIAKLLDQGLEGESATLDQSRVLTPSYASPEQLEGKPLTVQSDVYSLGVLSYQLLTGALPYQPKRGTLGALEEAILEGDPAQASARTANKAVARQLRGDLDSILGKSLKADVAHRYVTADAMAEDIGRHLRGDIVSARPDSGFYRLGKMLRRHWLAVASTSIVLIVVVSAGGLSMLQAQRMSQSAERERVVKAFIEETFRISGRDGASGHKRSPIANIEEGGALIQKRFAGQPELQAELFGVVGDVFSEMGAFHLTADYLDRRVKLLEQTQADSRTLATALLRLAKAKLQPTLFFQQTPPYAEVEQQLRRVLRLSEGHVDIQAEAKLLLARVLLVLDKDDEGESMLRGGEALLRPDATGLKTEAMLVRALLAPIGQRNDDVAKALRRAIELTELNEGRLSVAAATMRMRLANRLFWNGGPEVRGLASTALAAMRELGGLHALRAEMKNAFFWRNMWDIGQAGFDETQAVFSATRDALGRSSWPVPVSWLAEIDHMLGALLAARGDIAQAKPLLDSSVEVLQVNASDDAQKWWLAVIMAEVHRTAGLHESAERWAIEGLLRRRGFVGDSNPPLVRDYVVLAETFSMQGRHRDALAVIDEAGADAEVATKKGVTPSLDHLAYLARHRAKVLLEMGDAQAALQLMRANPLAKTSNLHYEMLVPEAIATCEAGSVQEGLLALRRELVWEPPWGPWHPSAPWLGWLQAHVGLCELKAKHPDLAREAMEKAQAIFAAQPNVSSYYKLPLQKLEEQLGSARSSRR